MDFSPSGSVIPVDKDTPNQFHNGDAELEVGSGSPLQKVHQNFSFASLVDDDVGTNLTYVHLSA